MNNDLEKMKEKVLLLADPDSGYTQEDFNKEFGTGVGVGTISTNQDYLKLLVNYSNKSTNQDPEYATKGSAGFDLRADLKESFTLFPGKRTIVPTGLYFHLPEILEMQIRSRSGLAAKNGVAVLNSPGTIDSDYRGEIKVILINHGEEDFVINHGDRIAQAVISSVATTNSIALGKVADIDNNTERGTGGFGSTGVK